MTILLGARLFRLRNPNPVAAAPGIFLKQGYDFRQKHLLNQQYLEPELGSKIDIANLQTSREERLSTLVDGDLILMAIVDPDCPACQASNDMLQRLHKSTDELGIKYLPMVFSNPPADVDAQRYAEALGFETCMRWAGQTAPPESLRILGTPSHVLVTKAGVILQTWSGSNVDQATRMRMADQISSDLYLINDVVKSIGVDKKFSR